MNLQKLPKRFTGTGEVKGDEFIQIQSTVSAYVYERHIQGVKPVYEVFKRKQSPLCIDFKSRLYSETDFKERYPKARDFGKWAWTMHDKDKALAMANGL